MRNPYRSVPHAQEMRVRSSRRVAALDEEATMAVQEVLEDIAYFESEGNPDTLERIIDGMEMLEEYDIDFDNAVYDLRDYVIDIEDAMTNAFKVLEQVARRLKNSI